MFQEQYPEFEDENYEDPYYDYEPYEDEEPEIEFDPMCALCTLIAIDFITS